MANAYTPGFHLNQWAAEDSFLREEFNNDNRILDETLLGLIGRTDLLERQVKPLGLEVYNLMLQNYYEGKETGYRQALAFDGFQDDSFLASVTPGAYHDAAQKQIRILPDVPNFSTGFAAEPGYDDRGDSNRERFVFVSWPGPQYETEETSFIPTGFGTLQQIKMRLACGSYSSENQNLQTRVEIKLGEETLGISDIQVVPNTAVVELTYQFSGGIRVQPYQSYTLVLRNVGGKYYIKATRIKADNNSDMGYTCIYTPDSLASGTVTSKDITLTQDYRKAIAWVRHTGTVGIKVRDSAGGYTDLVQESVRNTEELNGNACQESTFSVLLPDGTKNTSTAVQMVLTRGSDGTGVLYDYGVAFL